MEPKTVRREAEHASARHIVGSDTLNALLPGTSVLTLDGAIPVEFLGPGDRIITRNRGAVRLVSAQASIVRCAAVQIRAGSLGNARPDRDVVLTAGQEVLIRDWRAKAVFGASRALVPASRFVDGDFVRALPVANRRVVALVFDAPQILYADGLEVAAAVSVPA